MITLWYLNSADCETPDEIFEQVLPNIVATYPFYDRQAILNVALHALSTWFVVFYQIVNSAATAPNTTPNTTSNTIMISTTLLDFK